MHCPETTILITVWLPKYLHWPFLPGIFIAILAVVAAIAAFRRDPSAPERAAWIFVFLGLMCGEIWMVTIDRAASDTARKNAEQDLAKRFDEIGAGIKK